MANSENGAFQLGVPGLPPLLNSMVSGGLYAVQVSSPPARSALVTLSLGAAVRAEQPAVLVSNGSVARLLTRGRLADAMRDEKVAIFTLKESTAKNIFRHGPQRFLQELDLFEFPDFGYYVFDGADDLFTLQDPFIAAEQIRAYREYIREKEACGLLVFTLLGSNSQFASTYQALLDHVDGAVRLESGKEQLEWIVDFWASPSGVVASRAHPARIEANGVLMISELTTAQTPGASADSTSLRALVNAKDEKDVYFMDSTLAGIAKTAAEGKWTFCDNLVTLMHNSRDAVAASAVLVFDRNTDLRSLAQAVHTLRTGRGKNLKIIIRELDASLRYQNELLLLKLGASLVIHRDVPVARLQLAIQSLAGQVFSRDVDVNFENALASVSTSHGVGYLAPPQFVQQVGDIIERSKALAIPYALVRAKPPLGQPISTAAGRFKLTRNGDMVTATTDEILLFLSACPQASLLPTLKRVAGEGFEADYRDVRFAVQETAVKAELSDLLQLAKAGKAPVLSLPGKDPTVGSGTGTGTGMGGTGTGRTFAGHKS
jgi:cellulose biosynthesis protein BcsE